MPRKPSIIFNETVVAGTVLLLTSLPKNATLSPLWERRELICVQQLQQFGSIARRSSNAMV
jgi:hypothetical protein